MAHWFRRAVPVLRRGAAWMASGVWTAAGTAAMAAAASTAGFTAAAAPSGSAPLRVLILSGANNHDWRQTTPELKAIYEASGRFAVEVTETPAKLDDQALAGFDALVSNWAAWPDVTGRQWGPTAERAVLEFVRQGKGFALFHAASATFHDWPEFQELVGSTWDKATTGHGAYHTFKVEIADPDHPITRGLKSFFTADELWHRTGKQPNIHVLCRAFSAKERGGSGESEPVAITTQFGRGRGFHTMLGHNVAAMRNAAWKTLMLRGTEWAATGQVTTAPREPWPATAADAPVVSDKMIEPAKSALRWQPAEARDGIALLNGDRVIWSVGFRPDDGKPCFHPVSLVDGTELTWLRPPDHPWHKAFWFSWKFINGLNYWEEDPKTGKAEGVTEVVAASATRHEDFSARILVTLRYHPPGQADVLREARVIRVSPPDAQGCYAFDWESVFMAPDKDVVLDRTPIPGQAGGVAHGGYAGLSIRTAKDFVDWTVTDSEGRSGMAAHGQPARWLDWSGKARGQAAGIAIFDHPRNPRHPTPWYLVMTPQTPFGYFSPALIFHEPITVGAKTSLTLHYRVWVHPGMASREALEEQWRRFAAP